NLYLLGVSKSKKSTHKFIKLSQIATDKLIKAFNIKKESKIFSPYIYYIGQKK
ncbi:unnamed protein product, partial [marine sediment metagenome]